MNGMQEFLRFYILKAEEDPEEMKRAIRQMMSTTSSGMILQLLNEMTKMKDECVKKHITKGYLILMAEMTELLATRLATLH